MDAMASWPTAICAPLEYLAITCPPSAIPIWVNWAAGEPSCEFADTAEVCEYIVSRGCGGVELSKRLSEMFIGDAPLAKPVTANAGEGAARVGETGEVILPLVSNSTVPGEGICVAAPAAGSRSETGNVMA